MWQRALLVGSGLGLAVGLVAGCGASGTPSAAQAKATSPTAVSIPSNVPNQDAVRSSVTIIDCAKTATGWQASGTASNSTTASATYDITIFFTNAGAQDLGFGTAKVTVGAKKSGSWSAAASVPTSSPLHCILRGVATT